MRGDAVIEFDRDLEAFVQQEVDSGHFSSREALLSHAVRLLQRDREEAVAGILFGLKDADAGCMQPLNEAVADLRREVRERPAGNQKRPAE
jgi:Arc/MetJ-type ribon-helix-helix transcriptional regulator